jgi:hypothetical protein
LNKSPFGTNHVEANQSRNFEDYLVTHQVQKKDYFNTLDDRRSQVLKSKHNLDQALLSRALIKLHRHDLRSSLENELSGLLHQKYQKQVIIKTWVCML